MSFHANNVMASTGDVLTIEDKGQALDLEKLGWVVPIVDLKSEKKE